MNYKNVESMVKPSLIDKTSSPDGVYIRRNIKEIQTEEGATKFTYQETFLTFNEYESYSQELLVKEINGEENSEEYETYKEKMNTPVQYPANGFYYKPKWAEEIYAGLIQKGTLLPSLFPLKIWDSTEKQENAVEMSIAELTALSIFLAQKQEEYFEEYKLAKKLSLQNAI